MSKDKLRALPKRIPVRTGQFSIMRFLERMVGSIVSGVVSGLVTGYLMWRIFR